MKKLFPALFVNHGGGPLPLLGRQPDLAAHMRDVATTSRGLLPSTRPRSIVVISAHWEGSPVRITSSARPRMLFDYQGFPPETYEYSYPAPGDPALAGRVKRLLADRGGIRGELDGARGYDHGVFVPLMLMYPDADVPVVCVSLHSSLDAETHIRIGRALAPLRGDNVLILGSGYTFHNMSAFLHTSSATVRASNDFNEWLKATLRLPDPDAVLDGLRNWEKAPGARMCHPREEHLLPLFVVAAAALSVGSNGGDSRAGKSDGNDNKSVTTSGTKVIFDTTSTAADVMLSDVDDDGNLGAQYAVTGYLFE